MFPICPCGTEVKGIFGGCVGRTLLEAGVDVPGRFEGLDCGDIFADVATRVSPRRRREAGGGEGGNGRERALYMICHIVKPPTERATTPDITANNIHCTGK